VDTRVRAGEGSNGSHRVVLILAGGFGTRLWPLSRKDYPKQFIKLWSGRSTYQAAVDRAVKLLGSADEIFVVTFRQYRYHALGQAKEIGVDLPERNVIEEPLRRDTAPAIYYGLMRALEKLGVEDATVLVLPSDHLIRNEAEFEGAVSRTLASAEGGHISLVCVEPTKPEPGLGYIKAGEAVGDGVYRAVDFVEKPGRERALEMLREGGWYWSTMIMAFRASVMEEELRKHLPGVYEPLSSALRGGDLASAYERVQKIDISSGLLSKAVYRLGIVPTRQLGWSDLGSFESIYEIMDKDEQGNVVNGKTRLLDSSGNLVFSERLVALIGVRDMIIIDGGDAILVCPRGLGQRIKALSERLIAEGIPEALRHQTVYTRWGSETTLLRGQGYEVKSVRVDPGMRIDPHRHFYRFEYWSVLKGSALVRVDGEEKVLTKGMGVLIPPGKVHSLVNPGKVPLDLIEIATGEYLLEDDVERPSSESEFSRQ